MRKLLLSSAVAVVAAASAAPQVVTSIKPIYSLAAQVMDGVGEPVLLIKQGSPHGYQLKPADAKALDDADLLVYASDELETFLPPVLEKSKVPHVIEWETVADVNPLPTRHGGMWAEGDDDHDDHDHEDGDKDGDHDHEHGHKHDHDSHKHEHGHDHKHDHGDKDGDHDHEHGHKHDHDSHKHEHGHDHKHDHDHGDKDDDHDHEHDHHGHHHGKYDAHLWLDTVRSQLLVQQIAAELAEIDPDHAAQYQANAEKASENLVKLQQELAEQLAPVKAKPYLVFHDAYQYFEHQNGLNAVGTVRVDPEHEPGAKRIGELHQMMKNNDIVCVFSEPQFPAKIVTKLTQGTTVKTAVLDPVGADLPADKAMHGQLLRNIANNLVGCLAP